MSRLAAPLLLFFAICFLSACGGRGVTTSANPTPPPTAAAPAPAPVPATLSAPTTITVAAGQTTSGVDVSVASPAGSPAPNAQLLGVAPIGVGGSASSVGGSIHRGATMKVLLFGPGLNGGMTVTISGPGDIAVSNVRSITSVDGTSGVAFDAAVASNAALGARTVRLVSVSKDVTTFTGGLEVIP